MKNYKVRVFNNKSGKVEYMTVDAERLKVLIMSIWYDVFDVEAE